MKKIVLIDDDVDFLEWVSLGLSHDGYAILSAATGRKGLDIIRKDNPDLIIADIQLPDIDGFAICRALKGDPGTRPIPILLVTGVFKEIEAKEKGFAAGADDFLVKPFSYEQLRLRVTRQIQRAGGAQ
jgi:two-component system alkaline phosphatase synthesis response regulator PhoP